MQGLTENYVESALRHNLIQFQHSPNLRSLYTALFSPFVTLQQALKEVLLERHLENAVGKQLDGIGDILGMPRPYTTADGLFYFGFTGQSRSKGFAQAIIRSQNMGTGLSSHQYMSDGLYKRLLHWKIVANNSHGTIEDIIQAAKAAFWASQVVVEEERCKIIVNITRSPKYASEAIESIKEKLIPAAAGIFVTVNIINGE